MIHDDSLDRTTDMQGEVARLTMAEIRQANLGAASDPSLPRLEHHSAVPELRDLFSRFPGTEITVDVKDIAAADDVVSLIREFDRVEQTILYLEDGTGIQAVARQVPEVIHAPMRRWGVRIVTQELVRRVHDAGRTIQVWTISEPSETSRLAAWQEDGIITDDVSGMRATFGQRPTEIESEGE